MQPLGMPGQRENLAVIDARAFEHAAAVMQTVGQYMHLGVAPRHERPVHPNEAVSLIIRNRGHDSLQRLFLLLLINGRHMWRRAPGLGNAGERHKALQ